MRDELATEISSRLPDLSVQTTTDSEETAHSVPEADIVVTYKFPTELLPSANRLEWIQALSAGVDTYDLDRLHEHGIVLTNVSGVHAEPMAEQVLGYVLVFERNILRGIHQHRERTWESYGGGEIRGKTLGTVGVGAIGSRVAEVASTLGMTVVGTKNTPETAPDTLDDVYPPAGLSEILPRVDYLVVSCPLTDETRGLLGEAEFAAMPSSSVLVNVARGEIVDEEALVAALQSGKIDGAALNVFEEEPLPEKSPLWDRPDVVVTPHMAGVSPALNERKAELFAENYRSTLRNRNSETGSSDRRQRPTTGAGQTPWSSVNRVETTAANRAR